MVMVCLDVKRNYASFVNAGDVQDQVLIILPSFLITFPEKTETNFYRFFFFKFYIVELMPKSK